MVVHLCLCRYCRHHCVYCTSFFVVFLKFIQLQYSAIQPQMCNKLSVHVTYDVQTEEVVRKIRR